METVYMLAHLDSLRALLGVGDWIDLACLVVLILHIVVGLVYGFSGMLGSFTAMLLALQGGYWFYPSLAFHLGKLALFKNHATLTAILHYLLAVIVGLALFLVLRLLLRRFFRLLVEQPIDRIFGGLVGLAQGLMALFLIFSVFSLLPADSRTRKAVCESSRSGRIFTPVVRTILEIRPQAIIRFHDSGKQTVGRERKTRAPVVRPAPKTTARRARGKT